MLGTFGINSGDYQRAARFFADSLALLRERGDEKTTARGLGGLGTALLNLGDRAAAREMLEESLVVARKYGDRWSTAMSLTLVGHVDLADGDHARAQALLAEAASLFADTGNLMYLQWCLEGLAGAAAARGDYERAAELDRVLTLGKQRPIASSASARARRCVFSDVLGQVGAVLFDFADVGFALVGVRGKGEHGDAGCGGVKDERDRAGVGVVAGQGG